MYIGHDKQNEMYPCTVVYKNIRTFIEIFYEHMYVCYIKYFVVIVVKFNQYNYIGHG